MQEEGEVEEEKHVLIQEPGGAEFRKPVIAKNKTQPI
jgi:hypothetical protein